MMSTFTRTDASASHIVLASDTRPARLGQTIRYLAIPSATRGWWGLLSSLLLTVLLAVGVAPASARADGSCQFVLGFASLHEAIPDTTGVCIDNQEFAANGDALQHTTRGLMVWRKADNFTAFTDGQTSWVNGPYGIQKRLNTERFAWELQRGGPELIAPHRLAQLQAVDAYAQYLQEIKDVSQGADPTSFAAVSTPEMKAQAMASIKALQARGPKVTADRKFMPLAVCVSTDAATIYAMLSVHDTVFAANGATIADTRSSTNVAALVTTDEAGNWKVAGSRTPTDGEFTMALFNPNCR